MTGQDVAIRINQIAVPGVSSGQREAYRAAIEIEIARLIEFRGTPPNRGSNGLEARNRRLLSDEAQRMAAVAARAIYNEIAARQAG